MKRIFPLCFLILLSGCQKASRVSRTHDNISYFDSVLSKGYVLIDKGTIHAVKSCSSDMKYRHVSGLNEYNGPSNIGGCSICAKCIPPSKIEYVRTAIIRKYEQLKAEEAHN